MYVGYTDMKQTERFELLMTTREKELLRVLAEAEHISAAAVIRRLIWQEAERKQIEAQDETPSQDPSAESQKA